MDPIRNIRFPEYPKVESGSAALTGNGEKFTLPYEEPKNEKKKIEELKEQGVLLDLSGQTAGKDLPDAGRAAGMQDEAGNEATRIPANLQSFISGILQRITSLWQSITQSVSRFWNDAGQTPPEQPEPQDTAAAINMESVDAEPGAAVQAGWIEVPGVKPMVEPGAAAGVAPVAEPGAAAGVAPVAEPGAAAQVGQIEVPGVKPMVEPGATVQAGRTKVPGMKPMVEPEAAAQAGRTKAPGTVVPDAASLGRQTAATDAAAGDTTPSVLAKNSDLLTYYDRTGRIVTVPGSDRNRILNGDRGTTDL